MSSSAVVSNQVSVNQMEGGSMNASLSFPSTLYLWYVEDFLSQWSALQFKKSPFQNRFLGDVLATSDVFYRVLRGVDSQLQWQGHKCAFYAQCKSYLLFLALSSNDYRDEMIFRGDFMFNMVLKGRRSICEVDDYFLDEDDIRLVLSEMGVPEMCHD